MLPGWGIYKFMNRKFHFRIALAVYEILSYVDPKSASLQLCHITASQILEDSGHSTCKSVHCASATLCWLSTPQPLPTSHAPRAAVPLKRALNHIVHCTCVLTSTWRWPGDYLLNSGHCTFINMLQHPRHTVVGSYWTRSQRKHPDLFHTYATGVFHSVSHSTNTAFKKIISTPKADRFP